MIGNHGRQADAQVHIGAFGNVVRYARCHLVAGQTFHFYASCLTTRCTKIPGVTIASGSSSPSGTISLTCAMVTLAAMAMMGPKLRAVLRYTRLPQRSPRCALISAK